jgi:hypothetical protein
MNLWAPLSTSCYTSFQLSSFRIWVSIKSSINLVYVQEPCLQKKMLLVKHFHIKQQFRKNRCHKKESHYPFRNGNKHNRFISMRGNETVNLPILIFCTRWWPLHKTLERHVLNIFYPYILQDMRRSETPPNHYISLAWKTSFFSIIFCFFYASYQKSHNLYDQNELSIN